jgi:hypothetical protein
MSENVLSFYKCVIASLYYNIVPQIAGFQLKQADGIKPVFMKGNVINVTVMK